MCLFLIDNIDKHMNLCTLDIMINTHTIFSVAVYSTALYNCMWDSNTKKCKNPSFFRKSLLILTPVKSQVSSHLKQKTSSFLMQKKKKNDNFLYPLQK